jgi:hypothetical protein
MEPNKDTAWLHKMAEAEDGADVSVGTLPSSEQVEELTAAVGPEILAEVDKAVEESGQKKVPQLSEDEKKRLMNRAKKMREKAERFGKLHFATKPGQIIAMSDRHYQVAPDGSFRFVRMLDNDSNRPVPNNV